jgi:hypothetical protein
MISDVYQRGNAWDMSVYRPIVLLRWRLLWLISNLVRRPSLTYYGHAVSGQQNYFLGKGIRYLSLRFESTQFLCS